MLLEIFDEQKKAIHISITVPVYVLIYSTRKSTQSTTSPSFLIFVQSLANYHYVVACDMPLNEWSTSFPPAQVSFTAHS